jgi:hypothetical protein
MLSQGVPTASAAMPNPVCGDTSTSQAATTASWSISGRSIASTDRGTDPASSPNSARPKLVLVRPSRCSFPIRQNMACGHRSLKAARISRHEWVDG